MRWARPAALAVPVADDTSSSCRGRTPWLHPGSVSGAPLTHVGGVMHGFTMDTVAGMSGGLLFTTIRGDRTWSACTSTEVPTQPSALRRAMRLAQFG